jgi:dTDP-4-amino-4,6-dideoxygalactose transaminase
MLTRMRVPFNRVAPVARELEYVNEALAGGHISGHGPFTARCEALLERELGVARALLTTSCTHALEMAALLLDLGPGDEVIVPAFTFVSTINAFVLRGARPVFVDVRDDTLNIDEGLIVAAITPRTRAIILVHYAGVACDLDTITRIAAEHSLTIIEDNAHGLFGRYRGEWLGRFGRLAALSFHETKNFSCGEGGALLVGDATLVERAEVIREKGTDRSRFLRREVDKYTWRDIGSSYIPSDLLAAFLLGQLEARTEIQARRRAVFMRYREALSSWAQQHGVRTLTAPPDCEQPYHMFYLRLRDQRVRDELIQALGDERIMAVSHYVPLHLSPMGRHYGYQEGDLPVTERASEQLLRLPFYSSLDEDAQRQVCNAVLRFDASCSEAVVDV